MTREPVPLPPFWERPEVVDRFAERQPDLRLLGLLDRGPPPRRALDLGCAGGRNTVLLARRGVEVDAVDASLAMVRRTRDRLAPLLGREEADRRVRRGRMDDLRRFADGTFDLVLALGIYHNAADLEEWRRAVGETVRVMAAEGRLLVAVFTPRTDLTGEGVTPLPGEPHVYAGFPTGRGVLMEADDLDRELSPFGLRIEGPAEVVEKKTEVGRRVSVNALYRKRVAAASRGSTGV